MDDRSVMVRLQLTHWERQCKNHNSKWNDYHPDKSNQLQGCKKCGPCPSADCIAERCNYPYIFWNRLVCFRADRISLKIMGCRPLCANWRHVPGISFENLQEQISLQAWTPRDEGDLYLSNMETCCVFLLWFFL